jgi:hypothetical protein
MTRLSSAVAYWAADTAQPLLESTVGGALRLAAALAPDRVGLIWATPNAAARRR